MEAILINLVLKAAKLLTDKVFRDSVTDTKDAAKKLWEALQPDLPVKPDGSAWTQVELDTMRDAILDRADRIDAMLDGSTT